ncbi:hypothetical protein [Blautia sp.]|uniref:hypothetical protein n=1 Tax=Blautia sp. TaxID=1955243 RepID=UPI003AB89B0D
MIRISFHKEEDGLQVVISKTFRKSASDASEASACNVPCHGDGVAAGESRTNTALTKRKNDKKSKKSVSLISDICGCGRSYSRILVVLTPCGKKKQYVL